MSTKRFLALATFALAGALTSSAFAHAKLQSSDPRAGSTLDSVPNQIRLKFNEALEPAFSRIRLSGPRGQDIPLGAATVDKADTGVMTVPMPPLSAGDYRIRWSTMTRDGHKAKGEVPFKVR